MRSTHTGRRLLAIVSSIALLVALFTTAAIAAHLDPGGPSGNGVQPVALHGNINCSAANGDFELRINAPADGTFPSPLPTNWDGFSVTLDVRDTADGQVFDFTASGGSVETVFVKAGPHTNRYSYAPAGTTADTSLHGVVNPSNDQFYGLSHISICYNLVATPTIVTMVSSAAITLGGSVTDTATLSGGNNPTGTITFTVFGPNDGTCATTGTVVSTETVAGNGNYTSDPFTPSAVGTYRWIALYSGDPNNAMVTTACNDANETVTVSAAPSDTNTTPSSTVSTTWTATLNDSATVTGNNPTGNVTFNLFKGTCAALGTAVYTEIVALDATGNASTSPGLTVGSASTHGAGTYNWIVSYEGDANNAPSASACGEETQVVTAATPASVSP
jgi:hypothetical protein